MLTVGDVLALLKDIDPGVWVILNGSGPACRMWTELGAGEPFIVLEATGERPA